MKSKNKHQQSLQIDRIFAPSIEQRRSINCNWPNMVDNLRILSTILHKK